MAWFFIIIGLFVGFIYLASISTDLQNRAKREREEKLRKDSNCTEEEWKRRMDRQAKEKFKQEKTRKDKILELERQNVAYCPKCLSQSISVIPTKKNITKRAVAAGAIGVLTAKDEIKMVCLKCKNTW